MIKLNSNLTDKGLEDRRNVIKSFLEMLDKFEKDNGKKIEDIPGIGFNFMIMIPQFTDIANDIATDSNRSKSIDDDDFTVNDVEQYYQNTIASTDSKEISKMIDQILVYNNKSNHVSILEDMLVDCEDLHDSPSYHIILKKLSRMKNKLS